MPHKAYYSSKIQQTTAKETAISIAIKQMMTMKTVFISYDQAHHDGVIEALSSSMCRGYTILPEAGGKGSHTGEPHLGTHAWPAMNEAILTICDDHKVQPLLDRLKKLDIDNPLLGLRAFVWNVEQSL